MGDKAHWEQIYATKAPDQVSWFQVRPELSRDLIRRTAPDKNAQIVDIGAGASSLVDCLLEDGFRYISVLDISSAALVGAKERLGARAEKVIWIEADITQVNLPPSYYDVWHDRAVFHFLANADDRQKYIDAVKGSLKSGGCLIVAAFASDGPTQCSGLPVMRYSPDLLQHTFGDDFELMVSQRETHRTPFNTQQQFIYCCCRKR